MQATEQSMPSTEISDSRQRPGELASFLLILVQLLLAAVFVHRFNVERGDGQHVFLRLLSVMIGGFAIHAWLPKSIRMWFFALLSCGCVVLYLEPASGCIVLALGALLIGVGLLPVEVIRSRRRPGGHHVRSGLCTYLEKCSADPRLSGVGLACSRIDVHVPSGSLAV